EIHVWDLSGLRSELSVVPIRHPLMVNYPMIRPSPHGDVVATMGVNAKNLAIQGVWFVDMGTGTRSSRLRVTGDEDGAGGWSPDGRRYAVGYDNGWIRAFQRGDSRRVLQRRVMNQWITEIAYTPDGRRLAVVGTSGRVTMLDAHTLLPIGGSVHLPRT